MTSFWHLTTLSCIPAPNPEARLKEQRIFRQAAADAAERMELRAQGRTRSRVGAQPKRVLVPR